MTAPVTHRAAQEQGPSVVGGRLVWTSATGISSADPHSTGGCLRKWWFEQVDGRKGPATSAQSAGTALHAEIESHLLTGTPLTQLASAGARFIPHRGPGLHIERPIHFKTSSDVDIYGHVDLYNLRTEYLDEDGVLQPDAPWSFEVRDWKTSASFDWMQTPFELATNIQLVTYAHAGLLEWPDLDHARLTHVYFLTKGRPQAKLATVRRTREEINQRWQYAESVVRSLADAAKETNAVRVTPNRKSCGAYGGCPHRAVCTASPEHTSLDALYGKITEDYKETQQVGLLEQVMKPQTDIRAQLAAEEERLRTAQAALAPRQQPGLLEAWAKIESYGRGIPSLAEGAAQAYSVAKGYGAHGGSGFAGAGQLAQIRLTAPEHILQLAAELAGETPAEATAPAPQAAAPVMSPLPPDAPQSIPALAQTHVATAPAESATVTEAPRGRGRPKKAKEDSTAAPEASASAGTPTAAAPSPTSVATQVTPVQLSLPIEASSGGEPTLRPTVSVILINARFANRETKSLAGYVDGINAALSQRYSVTEDGKPGIQDVRCVPKSSVLAFGAWKGAVREIVKSAPPPDGDWHLDTHNDELNEIVADALRVVTGAKGWLYVRGL